MINNLFASIEGTIAIGFGYGKTVKEAEQNAKIAQGFAKNNPIDHCFYILTSDKELFGGFPKRTESTKFEERQPGTTENSEGNET